MTEITKISSNDCTKVHIFRLDDNISLDIASTLAEKIVKEFPGDKVIVN